MSVEPNCNKTNLGEQQIREALLGVIDPEVGINIVDLGLVYGIHIDGPRVRVTMTMTSPACPLSEKIKRDINDRLMEHCRCINQVEVDLVWDPPWDPEKMSDAAKEALGWSM